MTCTDCLESLGPFVDGELATDEAAVVEEHLKTCADCAGAHRRLLATSSQLKAALVRYQAPDVLKARIKASLTDATRGEPGRRELRPLVRGKAWPRMVAAAATVAIVSSALTFAAMRQSGSRDSAEQQVLASHIRSLMPGHLTDVASNDQHNVKPWFNGRVDMSPDVPRLDSIGFPLVGGRIDYINGRSIPVIVYTRRQHVINVFSWPESAAPDQPSVVRSNHGYNLIRLAHSGDELWIVSDLNRAELETFAKLLIAAH